MYTFELHKNTAYLLVRIFIIVILFCSAQLNYYSHNGTWYGDFESEIFHGFLSFYYQYLHMCFQVLNQKILISAGSLFSLPYYN